MDTRVKVQVDEDLSDLIPDFLARKHHDLETIRDWAAPRNYADIGRIGHRLKGDGGAYGLERISEVGIQLEQAAGRRDDTAIGSLAAELLDYLDHIDIVYCAMEE